MSKDELNTVLTMANLTADAMRDLEALCQSDLLLRRLRADRLPCRVKYLPESKLVTHSINGVTYQVSLPVTFTPFASVKNCSARCIFCSETLCHKEATVLSASLRPAGNYFEGLRLALRSLLGIPIGISLSGLESTDDADWLSEVLDLIEEHENDAPGCITEKVLYTNAAGLARSTSGLRLIPRLTKFGLDRAEVSRHHHHDCRNYSIMRFRDGQDIRQQAVFDETVRTLGESLHVRLVCVIQQRGVNSLAEAQDYLRWALDELNVTDVVFREFSRTHDLYRRNATLDVVENERISIEDLLCQLWDEEGNLHPDYRLIEATLGYYYWNLRFLWRDKLMVSFETSDYLKMKSRHRSAVIYKLIYHANGNLCADWDPLSSILLRTV